MDDGTIFKPRRAKEIEEQLMMCNLNDEHDNLRSIFCNPTPVIAVATNVESLYSLDCSDVQPDVGLYEGNGILCKGMIEITFVFFFFLFFFFLVILRGF